VVPTEAAPDRARPHVLYVAWGFPPHRGPGTYRALATANLLVDLGCRVTVLTADEATFDLVIGGDHSLVREIDPRVSVLRVPFPAGRRDPVINRWPPDRVTDPAAWAARTERAELAVFPEAVYGPWRPRVEAAAQRLHRVDPVHLAIATGNPYVDYAVPQRLNVDHGVPFVLDDRDSWVLDVYTGQPFANSERIQQWLGWMLGRAHQAWFVNPPIADWHRRRYPEHADRIAVVENGWDQRFLDPQAIPRGGRDPLVVGFIGTISEQFPLHLLVEGWREARRRSPLLARAELRFFGQLGHSGGHLSVHARTFADAARDGVVHVGRWPKSRIGEAYGALDVLLFAKEGSAMVTSGKVYEYLATGLPVASVLAPEHDARRVLNGYPRWHPAVTMSAGGLADALVAAAVDSVDHRPDLVEAAVRFGARLRRDHLLEPALRDVLDRLPQRASA